jgi:cytochrome d ubiquinol oxidase subunit II
MPSSIDPVSSLTLWDSTSSHRTLAIMFWVSLIFVPIVLLYTSWAFWVMRGRMTEKKVQENARSMY